ncbi:hypothetical protein VM1G_01024 [Cytospora mali]|uniref:Uncharacterized protein n=1 Tax=Cytospora mali TaxID=578113 RepID=A0A194VKG8_CYTMA|nr:hypothetical protein VM1G_01024 [Valsa mali]
MVQQKFKPSMQPLLPAMFLSRDQNRQIVRLRLRCTYSGLIPHLFEDPGLQANERHSATTAGGSFRSLKSLK